MLDHHQFLFLLRLAESVQSIGEKVYTDTDAIFSDKSSSSGTLNTRYIVFFMELDFFIN